MYIASGQTELKVLQQYRQRDLGEGSHARREGSGAGLGELSAPWMWFLLLVDGGDMLRMATAAAGRSLYLCCHHTALLALQWQQQSGLENVAIGPYSMCYAHLSVP